MRQSKFQKSDVAIPSFLALAVTSRHSWDGAVTTSTYTVQRLEAVTV
jgi:hypothetical protein